MMMLEEPEWQHKDGDSVGFESDSYGCKVTSKISRPDMVFLGNKVRGNLDMTGYVHIGREKFLFDKYCIAQRKSTKKQKRSQILGLQN